MQPYLPPSLMRFTPEFIAPSAWIDHLPFGYDVVAALQPRLTVELGTHNGLSFFCFCQSIAENRVDGLCYAVDTWKGDAHSGAYDEQTFEGVQQQAQAHYPSFAYLMRMLFNDALAHFGDESIDLLHIDGLHTYEAVSEDFRNWYGKVAPGGLILFHDIQARIMDFGAWKFWEELLPQHSCFQFNHGFGLGVLRKPGGTQRNSPLLNMLFDSTPLEQAQVRAFYVHAAEFHDLKRKVSHMRMLQRQRKRRKANHSEARRTKPGRSSEIP